MMPDYFEAPYNAPKPGETPTMDGAALDFYNVYRWEKERMPTPAEMQSIGGVFTPGTAPVINTLAQEYAVLTRWFCEVPTCTTPNRNFFFCGTNAAGSITSSSSTTAGTSSCPASSRCSRTTDSPGPRTSTRARRSRCQR